MLFEHQFLNKNTTIYLSAMLYSTEDYNTKLDDSIEN
jgi:hypothetical protein